MQVADNLIVVHNVDQKSTNLYDIKLAEYAQPVCVDNLDVDTQYATENYHSDLIFKEEQLTAGQDGQEANIDIENDNDKFKGPNSAAQGDQMEDQSKQSKEYLEVNFQFNYTGDDEAPIKLGLDVAGADSQGNSDSPNQIKASGSGPNIYDTSSMIFIEPMFMVDAKNYRNYTIKLSLEKFIEKQRNMCRQAICLLNRTNNKALFL